MTAKALIQMMTYLNVQVERCGGDKEAAIKKMATFINSGGNEESATVEGSRMPKLGEAERDKIWHGLVNHIRMNGTVEGMVKFGP